ncbi:hypothetical protein [Asaia prunellae]|uniref:hypothetical protein n=1 Tax=Asaia prunellae TaxID=610245 RepID=UPI000B0FF512|nr:hypothetical protein [Asaia prunellae]
MPHQDNHPDFCGGEETPTPETQIRKQGAVGVPSDVKILLQGDVPVLRIAVPLNYIDRTGSVSPGQLVATRPLVNSHLVNSAEYVHPATDPEDGATDLWLYTGEATPVALTPNQKLATPWSPSALTRLNMDLKANRHLDHFQVGGIYYTLGPGYGPACIVAVSARSIAETRALQLFLARVTLIVLILIVELLLVALAAQRYLVEPLEKLAISVATGVDTAHFNLICRTHCLLKYARWSAHSVARQDGRSA